jgi:transcriptional regulator with XRE-family HTH domain
MSDSDELNDNPARSTTNRKPSLEICCRLADNLRRFRHNRGYTQETLAKYCGLQKTYVSNVEQAIVNISLANLEALAIGLRCGADELLRRQLPLPRLR